MSSIGSSSGFDRPGLPTHLGLGALGLDELRRQDTGLVEQTPLEQLDLPSQAERLVDEGETVLNLAAWEGVEDGARLLQGDTALETQLSSLELGPAADMGTDAVLNALG